MNNKDYDVNDDMVEHPYGTTILRLPAIRCRRQESGSGIGSPMLSRNCTTRKWPLYHNAGSPPRPILSEIVAILVQDAGATYGPIIPDTLDEMDAGSQTLSLSCGNAVLVHETFQQLILIILTPKVSAG